MAVRAPRLDVSGPRAVGVRVPYPGIPQRVRDWVDDVLGSPVVSTTEQVGGMSTGQRDPRRLRRRHARVREELNPDSPNIYRREVTVLGLLGRHEMWAALLASYDADGWVALVLEDVDGTHPDLSDDAAMDRLLADVDRLPAVLDERVPVVPAPKPDDGGLNDLRAGFEKWAAAFSLLDEVPRDLAPQWLVEGADEYGARVRAMAEQPFEHLVHWDIRNDNLLQRPDGSIVFVDWG